EPQPRHSRFSIGPELQTWLETRLKLAGRSTVRGKRSARILPAASACTLGTRSTRLVRRYDGSCKSTHLRLGGRNARSAGCFVKPAGSLSVSDSRLDNEGISRPGRKPRLCPIRPQL